MFGGYVGGNGYVMGVMSGMEVMGPTTFVIDKQFTYFGANFLNMFKKNPIQRK